MDHIKKILIEFELHSVNGIHDCFRKGVDPNEIWNGKPLIYELINMYTRGPRFRECIRAFVDHGLRFDDPVLLAVLLDDAELLKQLLDKDPGALHKKYSLDCTFTPLFECSLLHICAEYNHLACATILVRRGIEANIPAGIDEHGFGGHSPIFHTVNQHENKCIDMLNFLLSEKADLSLTVKGLIWGKGYDWETFVPSVNPISYAMMGLLRQFQRKEDSIYEVVSLLMEARYGINYQPRNVPNKYLNA